MTQHSLVTLFKDIKDTHTHTHTHTHMKKESKQKQQQKQQKCQTPIVFFIVLAVKRCRLDAELL